MNRILCLLDGDMRLKGNPTNDCAGSNTTTQDCAGQLTHDLFCFSWIVLWVDMLICVSVRRPEISPGGCSLESVHFGFSRQGLSLAWNLLNKQGCVGSKIQVCFRLSLPAMTSEVGDIITSPNLAFQYVLGTKQVFLLEQQAFYQLSYLPSSGSV